MKILNIILDGRPMTEINKEGFWDKVAHRKVKYFRDKLGRQWMAFHKWSIFRVAVEEKENG